jgi:chemosensory pili system protein ChpA (sensor histidine kinase/response regulator)
VPLEEEAETILHVLKRFFDARGYQVLAEKDGLKAVERLKVEKPAVVLTDIKIPSYSGVDLIKFIRQNMNDIPIVVMTAYPYLYPENRNGNEVEAYFLKPFDIDAMFSSVTRILGG